MLKLHNVTKVFDNVSVLDNINFHVKKSTIVGLAGPSGGGKSTLLRAIQKLETLDAGHIELNARIGFMFQDFQLFPHMTVLENLIYAPKLQKRGDDHLTCAKEILETLGLSSKLQAYPEQLSGGQKQRVALARSLMMKPDILLCDEPTSGLDVSTTNEVVSLLASVNKMGITIIIASHDLDFLTKISDRIFLLKNGTIDLDINPKDIQNVGDYLKACY